jgi:hypothetical protein
MCSEWELVFRDLYLKQGGVVWDEEVEMSRVVLKFRVE